MNKGIIIPLYQRNRSPGRVNMIVPRFEDCPRPHPQVLTSRLIVRDDFAIYNCLEIFKSYVNTYVDGNV
jgi:hypothetical protein